MSIFAGHTRFVAGKASSWNYYKDQSFYGPPPNPLFAKNAAATPFSSHHTKFEPTPQPRVLPVPASSVSSVRSGWTTPEEDNTNKRQKMDILSLPSADNMRYPYVPSERTHQIQMSPSSSSVSYAWPTQSSYRRQGLPPSIFQPDTNHFLDPTAGSSGLPGYDPTHHRSVAAAQSQPQQHPHFFQYHQSQPPQHLPQHPEQYRHQTHYDTALPFPVPPQGAAGALADLGLVSRDSRLDARWSSFMEDSGLLDSFETQ